MSCDSKASCPEEPHLCCWPSCQSAASRELTTALAEARAEGRRQGLEERYRAGAMDMRQTAADAINALIHTSYRDAKDGLAAAALSGAVLMVRELPLATNTPETQKPETGESDG